MNEIEKYFEPFRENTIGYNQAFQSPYGEKKIVYETGLQVEDYIAR